MRTRLIHSQVLELRGTDAVAFAHSQFMNDVRRLADGDWQWSGLLTPKGRLIAFFALYRRADDVLLAWLPAGGAEALCERLQRYVFRSKVVLDSQPAWRAIGCLDDPAPRADDALSLPFPVDGEHASRQLLLVPASPEDHKEETTDDEQKADASRWRLADLRLGVPYIAAGSANSEQFVPQWLSLDRLDAYSLKKGCYPGQEIVSRVHYLGQSKRAAFRLHGEGTPPPPMTRVLSGARSAIGDIVWSQADGSAWEALAVLGSTPDAAVVVENQGPAHCVPLPAASAPPSSDAS